jgi:uncharacterized protein YjbI with pentapeptide repeats
MYGYALALLARARGEVHPDWAKHLRSDVRSAFVQASRFLVEGDGTTTHRAHDDNRIVPKASAHRAESFTAASDTGLREAASDRDDVEQNEEADDEQQQSVRANLCGADLRGADFTNAVLFQTDFSNTLRDRSTNLSQADLSEVVCDVDLSQEALHGATTFQLRMEAADRVRRAIVALFLSGMAAILGGLLACVAGEWLGNLVGNKNLGNYSGMAGAAFVACLALWQLLRTRDRI